jgi:hypothetical protein
MSSFFDRDSAQAYGTNLSFVVRQGCTSEFIAECFDVLAIEPLDPPLGRSVEILAIWPAI